MKKVLELLKDQQEQIIEFGQINSNTVMLMNIKKAIAELENFKTDYDKINDAWVDCVERYESVLNKHIIKEKQTCDGCRHYVSINKSNTMVCSLSLDCIRKYVPKDRWESK